jgi:hypothetical protein
MRRANEWGMCCALTCAALLIVVSGDSLRADDAPPGASLAERAHAVLESRCARCHGQQAQQAGLDVLNRASLLEERGSTGSTFAFVVPGSPDKSLLVDAVQGGADSYMPKEGSPEAQAMTDAEKALLGEWVAAGAEFPAFDDRPFLAETQVLSSIREHLLKSRSENQPYLRYFTLTHLHNNPSVSAADLRLFRAALSKVVNSLTYERQICLPEPIPGSEGAVLAIDLRDLGWDRRDGWQAITRDYPYGLKYDFVKDDALQDLSRFVRELSQTELPYIRADWFVVSATRPPVYHELLDIPLTLTELERRLQFDIYQNILDDRVERSGYSRSGVSQQNRLLERHTTPVTPYFWISYDFLPRRARGDLTRFPLGPEFAGNPYNDQAFDHDGGEIIWSLPNGMQAYMLVNADGSRIDAGPIEVVFDRAAALGTPTIVNGISCIYCHRHGMITEFRDEIRGADAVGGLPREKVDEIFPPHDQMQRLVLQDQQLFMRSLEQVIGPYLLVEEDAGKEITSFPDPVGKVAALYFRDLTADEVALELGFHTLEEMQSRIANNGDLLRLGMGALTLDPPATMKREKWETRLGTSIMQEVSRRMQLGTPILP